MALIDKDDLHKKIREEYDRHKAIYDLYHHVERGGIVQGLSYASMILCKQPTIPDIDRAAILRLCNEIEDEVTDIAFNSTHYHIRDCCEAIRKYLKEIGKELTGNDDRRSD